MNSNEYQVRANNLAAVADSDVQQRMVDVSEYLKTYLECIEILANNIDDIKKYVFYNRQNAYSEMQPVALKHPEARERLKQQADLVHALMGMMTEAAELSSAVLQHVVEGKELDAVNILEELGDLDWYKVLALRCIGRTNQECQEVNINKLESRYKGGFSQTAANNRDLETERKILENEQVQDVNS